jgi:hypothetical protein
MQLTDEQMRAAHAARQDTLDPGPRQSSGDAEFDAEIDARIEHGQQVLEQYTLQYSPRYRVGTVRPAVPSNAVGALEVTAGYLAGQPCRRLAVFRPRK